VRTRTARIASLLPVAPLLRILLGLALLVGAPSIARAQVDDAFAARLAELRAAQQEVEAATDLSDAAKASAAGAYGSAIAALEQAAADQQRTLTLGEASEGPIEAEPLPAPPGAAAPVEALQDAREALRTELTSLETDLASVRNRIAQREERRRTGPGELADARAELSALRGQPLDLGEEVDPRVAAALRAERDAKTAALEARVERLIRENETFQRIQSALVESERRLESRIQEVRDRLESVTERILEDEASEARKDLADARQAAANARAALLAASGDRDVLEANVGLATRNVEIAARRLGRIRPSEVEGEDAVISQRALVERRREEAENASALMRRLEALHRRSSKAISNQQIGGLLRAERKRLLDERSFDLQLSELQQLSSQLELAQIDLEEELDALERERRVEAAGPTLPPPADAAAARDELLAARGRLIRAELAQIDELLYEFQRLETALTTERDTTRALRAFVEERVLWVRSASPLWTTPIDEFAEAGALLPGPADVAALPTALRVAVRDRGVLTFGALLLAFVLLAIRRRLDDVLEGQVGPAASPEDRRRAALSIQPTLGQIAVHALQASFLPLLAAAFALPLREVATSTGLVDALGARPDASAIANRIGALGIGIVTVLPAWFALDLARRIARPGGVGELTLQWGAANMRTLRGHLRWFLPTFIALAALSAALRAVDEQVLIDTFGRIVFCAKVAVSGAFLTLVLRRRGLTSTGPRQSFLARFKGVWFTLGVGGAALLALASLVGYHYTARNLWDPYVETIALLSALLLGRSIVARWILVNRRRLRIEQAREKRERADADKGTPTERRALEAELDETLDLGSLEEEMSDLLRFATGAAAVVGVAMIWAAFFPALGLFKEFELYSNDAGDRRTLWDLGAALLVSVVTFVLAKRLPGLLEFTVLNRFSLGSGERYAVRAITVYVVVAIGVLVALGKLGVTWGSVQWLAAAVSVGLGFGLQEIFANFVSGLILLFERPMRVGDLVTVGGVEGRVTEIRIRATTILDYDMREHVIPNREFVTGSLVNWTLSDIMTRLVIKVGIAYGSDIQLARRLMLQAADECAHLHRSPKPSVVFRNFGESSLDFDLRVYMTDRDYWPDVMNHLHDRVDALFRENDITIPFPQRDLHVRSAAPELVKVFGRTAD